MKHRGLDHLRDIRAVARGAGVDWQGGEANLVVDDEVEGAARLVTGELGEVERLRHRALAGEGGVAVDEERQHLAAGFGIAADSLPGAGLALDDRIDDFEVGGVGGEANLDLLAGGGFEDGFVAEVVFHVAVAPDGIRDVVFGKLLEEDLERFPHHAGEDVEAAAVGHAHDDLVHADVRAVFDDRVDGGDHGLAALEGKPLLADVFRVQEALKELGLVDAAENPDLFRLRKIGLVAGGFESLLQPGADVDVLNVGVFDANVAAVGQAEILPDLPQLHLPAAEVGPDVEGCFEIVVTEVERLEGKLRVGRGSVAQRIEVGFDVTNRTVGVDQLVHPRLLEAVDDGSCGVGMALVTGGGGECGRGSGTTSPEGEALKKRPPRRIDGIGILQPRLVGGLDNRGIGMSGKGRRVHGIRQCGPGGPPVRGTRCRSDGGRLVRGKVSGE